MDAITLKLTLSAAIVAAILLIVSGVGLTVESADDAEGVMIDFGQYEVTWVKMDLSDGMTGTEALQEACGRVGYGCVLSKDGSSVVSVNETGNGITSVWGMYVLRGGSWEKVPSPSEYEVGDEKFVSWARTSDAATMMPGVDATGFTYYSYADGGQNRSGSDLRLITLAPSVTETVCAAGGESYIVGTDRYSDYPESLRERLGSDNYVGGYTDPNYELIVGCTPDIVFLDGSVGEHVTMADKLRKTGVYCAVLYEVTSVEDLYKNLWICASAMGLSSEGSTYISALSETIGSVCDIANIQETRGFITLGTSESPFAAGNGTYADSILEAIGVTNIFSDLSSWTMVDKEAIYVKQPDVIIIVYEDGEITTQKEYDDVLRSLSDIWKDTPAFQNKRIYIFSGDSADLLSRPGARLGAVYELLAKAVDPQSFIDRDYWDRTYKFFGDDYADYLKYQQPGLMT